ncbi:hypothetical protein CMV_027247, partial [Castanea mollissima]
DSGVLGLAMGCSNTFGLVTGAFLLGFGLSEIPKSIWKNADWTTRQKVLSHKIAKKAVKLDDAHQELSNAIVAKMMFVGQWNWIGGSVVEISIFESIGSVDQCLWKRSVLVEEIIVFFSPIDYAFFLSLSPSFCSSPQTSSCNKTTKSPLSQPQPLNKIFASTAFGLPYVEEAIANAGNWLIGGNLKVLKPIKFHYGFDHFRLSPTELREEFTRRNANAVFAFQL